MSKKDPLKEFFESQQEAGEDFSFRFSHEVMSAKVPVIKTGSPGLDDALSSGGIPKGRLIQFYGPPASGKTLMSMLAIKEAQAQDPKALQLFIDSEGSYDPKWAAQIGVDPKRVAWVQGDLAVNGRRCFAALLGVPKEDKKTHMLAGKAKEGVLDKIAKGEKGFNFNLIVLDSLGALIPPGDDVALVGKITMAKLAKFLTQELKKVSLEVAKAKIPFIMINHKRDTMDPYSDHTFAGGNAYAQHLSAKVYFELVGRKDSFILDEQENRIGGVVRAVIEKSKFGPHPRKCEFKVDFRKGVIDTHEEIANLAIAYGIITKASSVSYEYGDQKWVGQPKLYTALVGNDALVAELTSKIEEARDAKREVIIADQDKKTEEVLEAADEELE